MASPAERRAEPNGGDPAPCRVSACRSAAAEGAKPQSPKARSRALALAAAQIDKLSDPSASAEERQQRKRRLLKGPKEFLDIRSKLKT
jgi:hypothetical protein